MAAVIITGGTSSWLDQILELVGTSTVTSYTCKKGHGWFRIIREVSATAEVLKPPTDYCPAASRAQQQTLEAAPSAVYPRIRGPPVKIKPEHREHLRVNIEALLTRQPELPALYEAGNFIRSEMVKDIQKRFCFDLMYMAGLTPWVCTEIYPYANDDHLYTALKSVCPTVIKKY